MALPMTLFGTRSAIAIARTLRPSAWSAMTRRTAAASRRGGRPHGRPSAASRSRAAATLSLIASLSIFAAHAITASTISAAAPSSEMLNQLGAAVADIAMSEKRADAIAEALNKTHRRVRETRQRHIEQFQQALHALDDEETRLWSFVAAGKMDDEAYRRQMARIKIERDRFIKQLAEANAELDDGFLETAKSILELATQAKSLWESRSPAEKRTMLEKVLSNPKLQGSTVRFCYRSPYDVVAKMAKSSCWRARIDDFRTALVEMASRSSGFAAVAACAPGTCLRAKGCGWREETNTPDGWGRGSRCVSG
jgi:hypothetical protein